MGRGPLMGPSTLGPREIARLIAMLELYSARPRRIRCVSREFGSTGGFEFVFEGRPIRPIIQKAVKL
jgi:hypothetical protein